MPLTIVRRKPGCSPNSIKSAFGADAAKAGLSAYAFAWRAAGLDYEQHAGRRLNGTWSDPERRRSDVKSAVRRLAAERGVPEIQAAWSIKKCDFARAGLASLLNAYHGGSPERAIRDAYEIIRRATRGEFRTWPETKRHLVETLKEVDVDRLSEEEFLRDVPGGGSILRRWGGFVRVMEKSGLRPFDAFRHTAPSGYWRVRLNRRRWVRTLVERVRAKLGDSKALPNSAAFERHLGGLLVSTKKTYARLLREAGYAASDPVDWNVKAARLRVVQGVVRRAGGSDRVTDEMLQKASQGLYDWYARTFGSRQSRGNTPILYEILRDAGYKRAPEDCEGRLGGSRYVTSRHEDPNASRWQAAVDEWVFAMVGRRHRHEVLYPGQPKGGLDCDFVLKAPAGKSDLWLEFAGLHGADGEIGRRYAQRLARKRRIAKARNLRWIALLPRDFQGDPMIVWRRMKRRAPWLPSGKALRSSAWRSLFRMPAPEAFSYASRKFKYTTDMLLGMLRRRIARYRRSARDAPLHVGACQKDPRFSAVYQAIQRRSERKDAARWAEWLIRAGMAPEEAARASRRYRVHDPSPAGVLRELKEVYSIACTGGREPRLDGAFVRRAIAAFGSVTRARELAKRALSTR